MSDLGQSGVSDQPMLLDLFCGAGGCSVGYARAGFRVVGVDVKPQPHYPFEFWQRDALKLQGNPRWLAQFDAIHASPPCQHYASITAVRGSQSDHADLIAGTRDLLVSTGLPYVIENVADARRKLHHPVMLCGSAFGLPLKRHRYFESNVSLMSPGCAHGMHRKRYRIRQHGREMDTAFCYVFGGGQAGQPVATWREAMDIDWMTVDELSQAIPPAYTEHIGRYLMTEVERLKESRSSEHAAPQTELAVPSDQSHADTARSRPDERAQADPGASTEESPHGSNRPQTRDERREDARAA